MRSLSDSKVVLAAVVICGIALSGILASAGGAAALRWTGSGELLLELNNAQTDEALSALLRRDGWPEEFTAAYRTVEYVVLPLTGMLVGVVVALVVRGRGPVLTAASLGPLLGLFALGRPTAVDVWLSIFVTLTPGVSAAFVTMRNWRHGNASPK